VSAAFADGVVHPADANYGPTTRGQLSVGAQPGAIGYEESRFKAPASQHSRSEKGGVGRQILARAHIRDAEGMIELVRLLLTSVLASVRRRQDLVLENLLLRHQLVVLSRPTRRRRRARLRT